MKWGKFVHMTRNYNLCTRRNPNEDIRYFFSTHSEVYFYILPGFCASGSNSPPSIYPAQKNDQKILFLELHVGSRLTTDFLGYIEGGESEARFQAKPWEEIEINLVRTKNIVYIFCVTTCTQNIITSHQ